MSSPFFAFVNAKGGSGATTIVAELAKSMRHHGKVLALDGDLTGRRNLAILLDALRALDVKREGNKRIGIVDVNGLAVVEMAPTFDAVFTINKEEVESLAASFSEDTDYALLDVPIPFAAPVRPFVVRTTRFVIVAEPTLLGIASAGTMVGELKNFGIPITRMLLLTNARGGQIDVSRAEIERVLGVKVAAELPPMNDRSYGKALSVLEKILTQIAAEPQLENVFPSAKGLAQDRRWIGARRASNSGEADTQGNAQDENTPARSDQPETHEKLKLLIHETLAKNINLIEASAASSDTAKLAELRAKIDEVAQQVLSDQNSADENASNHMSAEELAQIKEEIVNESLGLGPLEDLMADQAVTEIMVNGPKNVYVERAGRLTLTGKRFTSSQQLRLVIERIIAPLGRRLDESVPMVDARLPDGSRVNAIIEPLAIDGATLTIRRFGKKRLTAQDLIDKGSATDEMLDFMRACIEARLNVVISGGTGSGKTTFLNILSGYIPSHERIITVEDAAELFLNQPHVVRLETRPANLEGAGEIRIRDLVRNSLRMRPDRIVVGECRGGEALDMLQAMNTGHDGSLTTAHANSPRDALSRLETMVMMAGFDLPVRAIREQIASAVDIIIQIARMRDGSRKIVSISEIVGMEGEVVTMQEVVRYSQHGMSPDGKVAGEYQFTGVQPQALQRFDEYGVHFDVVKLTGMASASALW
jgi:pilus assembly protein CpaF